MNKINRVHHLIRLNRALVYCRDVVEEMYDDDFVSPKFSLIVSKMLDLRIENVKEAIKDARRDNPELVSYIENLPRYDSPHRESDDNYRTGLWIRKFKPNYPNYRYLASNRMNNPPLELDDIPF